MAAATAVVAADCAELRLGDGVRSAGNRRCATGAASAGAGTGAVTGDADSFFGGRMGLAGRRCGGCLGAGWPTACPRRGGFVGLRCTGTASEPARDLGGVEPSRESATLRRRYPAGTGRTACRRHSGKYARAGAAHFQASRWVSFEAPACQIRSAVARPAGAADQRRPLR